MRVIAPGGLTRLPHVPSLVLLQQSSLETTFKSRGYACNYRLPNLRKSHGATAHGCLSFGPTYLGVFACCVSSCRSPSRWGHAQGHEPPTSQVLVPARWARPLCLSLHCSGRTAGRPLSAPWTGALGTPEWSVHRRTQAAPGPRADKAGACTGAPSR